MNDLLDSFRDRIEHQLDSHLIKADVPATLLEAMRYAALSGGKRVRPTLVYQTAQALGADIRCADRTAAAIELIHAYSLIHDDLPSMDDDALRRGRPTCHIQFGEAVAILAGDALQALAFELIADDPSLTVEIRIEIIATLARACGAAGMVGGQVIDLQSENRQIDAATLETMHRRKTGDLISASVVCGAIIGGADVGMRDALSRYGYDIGLAFQVRDDILDTTGDTLVLGKQAGSDQSRRKSTFVAVHGLAQATAMLDDLREDAIAALAPMGTEGTNLRAMAEFVATRDH